MKLTEKSMEIFNLVKDAGGRVSVDKLVEKSGRTPRSVNANITDLCSEKKGLAVREKVAGEGEGAKDITYVVLTDAGMAFVPSDED